MDQLNLGIGTRLQHTQHGPGVIVGVRYATYLISFINTGVKEIEKTDTHLDEIIPENVTVELETTSDVERSLLKILRQWLRRARAPGRPRAGRHDAAATRR